MSENYKKVYLDPRCLKPGYDQSIYIDAIHAINQGLCEPMITSSERVVLETMIYEIRKNRFIEQSLNN